MWITSISQKRELEYDNHEPYCYLLGWLVQEGYEFYYGKQIRRVIQYKCLNHDATTKIRPDGRFLVEYKNHFRVFLQVDRRVVI